MKNKHLRAPLYEALEQYTHENLVHFDVPGHKKRMHTGLGEFFGERILGLDANSTKALDNLSNPDGIIKEAEALLADAYWADRAFMLVNGSTFGVQAMIMSVCSPKDKILMPRNVHKSAVNAVILSGAIPVFIDPEINKDYGIANGVSFDQVKKAVQDNPDAKAIFLINPTYFGVVSDLRAIIKLCRRRGLMVLVDEAHGAHFPFHNEFPENATALGADLATVSLHKTGGSLTQSSALLMNERNLDASTVRSTINLMQTTSASYLLMASIDLARRNLEINGGKIYDELLPVIERAKLELNKTPGLSVLTRDDINGQGFYDFDETKFVIRVNELGMTGFEVYDMLKDDYGIQVELAESYVILAIAGIGDDAGTIEKLVNALKDIAGKQYGKTKPFELEQIDAFEKPMAVVSPRDAYYSPKRLINVNESVGEICAESIMIYPPGIPLAVPGEKITQGIVDHFNFYRQQHCVIMHNSDDPDMIQVLGEAAV